MANPKCFYQDLSRYTLTATSTNASYPLVNLQTYFARDEWRQNNTTANTELLIDFGTARACDFIALENHNFDALGCDNITLKGADDSGITTNVVTAVADLSAIADPGVSEFSSATKRYWQIKFVKAIGSLSAVPAIGNVFLGAKMEFSSPYEFGSKRNNARYETSVEDALDGSRRTAQAFAGRRVYELLFKVQSDTAMTNFKTFIETVRGRLRPFYYLDADGTTLKYMLLASDYNPPSEMRYGVNDIESLVMETQQVS